MLCVCLATHTVPTYVGCPSSSSSEEEEGLRHKTVNTMQTVQTLVVKLQATAISIETQTNQIMQTQQLMGITIRWAIITNLTLSLTPNPTNLNPKNISK